MASEVTVANAALSALGEPSINSLDQVIPAAQRIKTRFADVRDAVLRAAPWNFAEGRAALPALSTTPAWGYTYEYQLPSDCLFAREIENGGRDNITWKVEGRKILTDEGAPLNILYTRQVTDPNEWDSLFIQAFAARLAWDVAPQFSKSKADLDRLEARFKFVMAEAGFVDGQEGTPPQSPDDPLLSAMV